MPLLHTFDKRRWSQAQQTYLDERLTALPDEQIRPSSRGRPWHGLSVWHQVADASDLYIPQAGKHCIIVRNGPPTPPSWPRSPAAPQPPMVQCLGLSEPRPPHGARLEHPAHPRFRHTPRDVPGRE